MDGYLQIGNFLVALLALGVLIWYAIETMKLRKAAMEQVESTAKPVLTLCADLRDAAEAILEIHDAVGAMVVRGANAQFLVQNIGNGIALNVSYSFRNLDTTEPSQDPGYLFYVLQTQKIQLPVPMTVSSSAGNCEAIFCFESIGGKRYESKITMNNHVLTHFRFSAKP